MWSTITGNYLIIQIYAYYNKNHLPYLTITHLVLLDEIHIKQVSGPPTTSQKNEYNFLFPRNEEGELDTERGVNDTNSQPNRETFKYKQKGRYFLV